MHKCRLHISRYECSVNKSFICTFQLWFSFLIYMFRILSLFTLPRQICHAGRINVKTALSVLQTIDVKLHWSKTKRFIKKLT